MQPECVANVLLVDAHGALDVADVDAMSGEEEETVCHAGRENCKVARRMLCKFGVHVWPHRSVDEKSALNEPPRLQQKAKGYSVRLAKLRGVEGHESLMRSVKSHCKILILQQNFLIKDLPEMKSETLEMNAPIGQHSEQAPLMIAMTVST